MLISAIYPLVAAVIGALLYFAVKTNAELKETGRLLMFAGFIAALLVLATARLTLGGG